MINQRNPSTSRIPVWLFETLMLDITPTIDTIISSIVAGMPGGRPNSVIVNVGYVTSFFELLAV